MTTEILWFFLVGAAFIVFSLLDGFDMGVAMLTPFFPAKSDTRHRAIDSIWPVWDGNELWGLAGAGALLAVFPLVFNQILTGMYPVVILLIVALIFRPIAFELSYHTREVKNPWYAVFALSGFALAFIIGIVFGNTIWGFNQQPDGTITGGLFSIFNPFSLLTGLLLVSMFLVHGAAWLIVKLESKNQKEALSLLKWLWFIPLILLSIWAIWVQGFSGAGNKALFWIFSGVSAAGYILIGLLRKKVPDGVKPVLVLLFSLISILMWWLTEAVVQFPVIIRSRIASIDDLTIYNSGSIGLTSGILGWLVPVILVIVITYTIFVYRVFKGKVKNVPPSQGGIGY